MSIDITPLRDDGRPDLSEQRFRAALPTASADDALILHTQIARTWGLRKDFDKARQVLQGIADQVPMAQAQAQAQVQVRYARELGRTYASPAHPRCLVDR